jgi:hypothetical protein
MRPGSWRGGYVADLVYSGLGLALVAAVLALFWLVEGRWPWR